MKNLLRPVLGLLLCASYVSTVHAVPGDWDRSFAQDGRIRLEIANVRFTLRASQVQPDGKVVVVGHTLNEVYPGVFLENSEFIVARFNTSGTPDSDFDGDGYLTFQFGSDVIGTVDMKLQADGKLLIVGQAGIPSVSFGNTSDRARLLRLNTNGSRDTSYGPAGEVVLAFTSGQFLNPGLALLANGSALVYGDFGANDPALLGGVGLVRVTAAGQLDNTFGTGGLAVFRGPDRLSSNKVSIAADGSIYVGATMGPYNNEVPVVGRVTSTGLADSTFGTGGLLALPFLKKTGWITAITATGDGRVLLGGRRHDSYDNDLPFIARVTHEGTMDATFGSSGRIIPAASYINSLVVEPDGKIVAAGSAVSLDTAIALLARYNPDGSPDLNFGVRGLAHTDFSTEGNSTASALSDLVRNADGSYLALVAINNTNSFDVRYALARFRAQGASAGVLGIRAEYENSGALGFSLSETSGHARFLVTRTGGTEGAVSVQYRVIAETATAGQDFTPVSGTLTFNDGETRATFDVPVIDDNIPEYNGNDRFYAELFAPTGGAGISKPRATIDLASDLDDGTHIEIYNYSPATVLEGSVARIVLYRARFFSDPVTVSYTLNPQNATPGVDYTGPVSGSVQWAAGEGGLRYIDVPTANDGTQEPDEYITVNFSEATGLANMNGAYQNIVIVDDDDPAASSRISVTNRILMVNESAANATWTVRRTGDDSQALSVPWSIAASSGVHAATAGEDYTAANGTLTWNAGDSTNRTITVPLLNDTALELYEIFSVNLAAPVPVLGGNFAEAFILDNDGTMTQPVVTLSAGSPVSEGAGTFTVTATPSGHAEGAISVSWQLVTESAMPDDVSADFASLYWVPGDTSPREITVTINQDTRDEIDETFFIILSNPVGGVALVNRLARFTILDDDATPAGQAPPVAPGVEAVASSLTVNEATQTASVQLRRTGETGNGIYVEAFGVDGTATSPADFMVLNGSVYWEPNETGVKNLEVQINGDTIAEATESMTLRLLASDWTSGELPPQDLTLSITDDDNVAPPPPPARVSFVNSTETIAESATSITVQIGRTGNLSVASSVDYTAAVGTAGASDFTASTGTLTWAAGDSANKSLTITLLPDTTDEPNESFTITLSAPSSGTEIDTATTIITITDDDAAPPAGGGGGGGGSSSGGSGSGGGGGAESYLTLLALASLLIWRRHPRRRASHLAEQV